MNLAEAWDYAAALWDDPRSIGAGGIPNVQVPGAEAGVALGLCVTVSDMWSVGLVSEDVYDSMLQAIPKAGTRFAWPTTFAGAFERAAFCREQAAKARA